MNDRTLPHTSTAVPGTILSFGSLTAAIKTHLSINHIFAAAVFARRCKEIEDTAILPLSADLEVEHRSYAIGAPIEAAAFLEAAVNELYIAAVDNDPQTFGATDGMVPELMAELWEEIEEKGVLAKYQTALLLARKPRFDEGNAPYQPAGHLVALRDMLLHYKPEWDARLIEHKKIEGRLRKAFPENPFAAKDKAFFPAKCLGYGCAAWSVRTAWTFLKEFYVRMDLPYWALGHESRIVNI